MTGEARNTSTATTHQWKHMETGKQTRQIHWIHLDTLCDFDTFGKNMMEYVSQNPGLGVPIRGYINDSNLGQSHLVTFSGE